MDHSKWMSQTTAGDSIRSAALKAGIAQRTLAHQVDKGSISAENVIAVAVAYGVHPVSALVDTGYLDPRYARQVDPMTALRQVTEEQLAQEVMRRMKIGVKSDHLTADVNDLAARRQPTAPLDSLDDDGLSPG
ncbi:hypothetical protein [Corynebacterium lizhenjunii]|uniref:hypothetical protein n=1 Tax=Corynebacterium lizhenjunii TaxID=2709394 RepID=UPI0013EA7263|nr:hypothetical protein [Corynebacterium lizhenjunii]